MQRVEFPNEDDTLLSFQDFQKQMKVPFIIFADSETFVEQMDSCEPNPDHSSTTKTTKFEPCGFGYQVVCMEDRYTKPPVIFRGSDVSKHFLECIIEEEKQIKDILHHPEPLIMTLQDEQSFVTSSRCHICGKHFTDSSTVVRDHCHLSGKFRGAAHTECNLKYKYPSHIPCVFHNLKQFDAHILTESKGIFKDRELNCIPNTTEKYISFSLGDIRFIDSFQFMSQSLETLTENLAKEGVVKFNNFSREFTESEAKLLLRKGVYPYEYVDNPNRFFEQKLPPKEKFYSSLSRSHVSDADYTHAQNVWEKLNISNLGQYHDLYLKTDVLLLADVFENFRNMCLEYYGLDAAHFYTSPGLAWSAALNMTEVRLELIRGPDMYLFFENGIRGGVSMISNKYALANNPYIPETWDLSQPHSYIMYTDCNNLYGKAMSESLPVEEFQWVESPQSFDIAKIAKDGDLGYVLEVDLEYPDELHVSHSDYPLAPERKKIPDIDLSPTSKQLWETLHPNPKHTDDKLQGHVPTAKLIPTLERKTKYICHYRNLQLYSELGLKVAKIHRILEFKQKPWLRPYIQFNTSKRASCKNEFEKDFFKLMNNAVFGKTMENVRSRVDIKLAHTDKKFEKYVARPSFQRFTIFNEDLVAIQNDKIKLVLNKPVYVGQTILDLSKCIMYEFYYKYLKPRYGDGIKLLMTDTDSLLYHVQCPDVYDDMYRDRHLFDLSNYPIDHRCHDTKNKKIPGYFKDETGSEPIAEFVGLRAKMYSYVYAVQSRLETDNPTVLRNDMKEKQVAKGIAMTTIRRDLRHEIGYRMDEVLPHLAIPPTTDEADVEDEDSFEESREELESTFTSSCTSVSSSRPLVEVEVEVEMEQSSRRSPYTPRNRVC
ncbi:uncharacterized protein LOC110443060 [Mizuhopecten yessoensis]|uniref:uncharacterized protein LOC110443060 n=1 Tax=Mizuhopecten yessoensis TaxID=6573 RepID=UPI000B45B048|nr:uncharacterized protein LOC110443060 [Mizuhopecten yessoensis]